MSSKVVAHRTTVTRLQKFTVRRYKICQWQRDMSKMKSPFSTRSVLSLLAIFFLICLPLISAHPSIVQKTAETTANVTAQEFCPKINVLDGFDVSVKIRGQDQQQCFTQTLSPRAASDIFRRAVDDDYSCSETKPCSNGACCPKATGYCNFGPEYCGTNGQSPNDVCWSNCNAHPECGVNAKVANTTCPLNVCCSEFGYCGLTSDFCAAGCQSNCNQPGPGSSNGNVQSRIIGYYESWQDGRSCIGMNWQGIPVESLTHINCE